MSKVISVAMQKGGSGKTPCTRELAYAFVSRGKTVLCIDLDPQASLTKNYGYDPVKLQKQGKTISQGLVGDVPLESLVIPGNEHTPSLIPASSALSATEQKLWDLVHQQKFPQYQLKDKLRPIRNNYDYIIIDCRPTLGLLTSNALTAADGVLIPVNTHQNAVDGLDDLFTTIHLVRSMPNPSLRVYGILPTRYAKRNNHDNDMFERLKNDYAKTQNVSVFDPMPATTNYDKASAEYRAVLQLFPDTPGIQNYYKIAEHIEAYG